MATLLEIRTRALQRADMAYNASAPEAVKFATTTEVDALINTGYKELYGLLMLHGLHRSEEIETVTATGATTYALPTDMFGILGVWRNDNGYRIRLTRHDHRLRPNTAANGPANTYRVLGSSLELNPCPSSGTYEVMYVPVPGTLVDDTDALDGVLGWEEYVVLWVAIQLRIKEETDEKPLLNLLDKLTVRIQDEAQAAEFTEGQCIADVRYGRDSRGDLPGDYTDRRPYRGNWRTW
jgi:hypothetical protein